MNFFTQVPVHFINNVTPMWADIITFCATTLGVVMACGVLVFLIVRKFPYQHAFSTFEHFVKKASDIFTIFVASFGSYLLSVMFKNIFMIGRPAFYDVDLHPILNLTGFGFPSSHASFYGAMAVMLFFIDKEAGAFAIFTAFVIGVARIFAGVHSPVDILGGFILGILVAVVVDFVVEKLNDWKTA